MRKKNVYVQVYDKVKKKMDKKKITMDMVEKAETQTQSKKSYVNNKKIM